MKAVLDEWIADGVQEMAAVRLPGGTQIGLVIRKLNDPDQWLTFRWSIDRRVRDVEQALRLANALEAAQLAEPMPERGA